MDSVRAFEEELDYGSPAEEDAIEAPPEIGVDERRMHVRAYNHWVSLLEGRSYPSIRDLDPESLGDFGPHSVLLDFSDNADDPKVAWLGRSLRSECELIGDIRRISDVPKRSLLSRLTDHTCRSSPIARRSASRPSSSASAARTPCTAGS